jgi:exonuclease III
MATQRLRIGSVNMNGILNKVNTDEFMDLLEQHDILCVQESWLENNGVKHHLWIKQEQEIQKKMGYLCFKSSRTKKHKAKRGSGGVVLFFKQNLQKGLTKIQSLNSDCLWVKMDSNFFGLEHDIYLCNAYIVPDDSNYFRQGDTDVLSILSDEIGSYSTKGQVLIMGDINARTGEIQETLCIELLEGLGNQEIGDNHRDTLHIYHRHNQDKITNSSGRALTQMLNEIHCIQLNGRTPGDLNGEFTYHGSQGSSAIDLGIISAELLNKVIYFRVLEPTGLGDHCPISLLIKINRTVHQRSQSTNLHPYMKFIWDDESDTKFREYINSVEIGNKLQSFCSRQFQEASDATRELTSILQEVGKKSVKLMRTRDNRRKGKVRRGKKYEPEIQKAKREFKRAARDFKNNVHVVDRRITFIRARRMYKKTVYRIQKLTKEQNLQKLSGLEKKDPKYFWKIVRDLIKPGNNTDSTIAPSEWTTHFRKLLNINHDRNFDRSFYDYVKNSLPVIENEAADLQGPLDSEILESEVFIAIKKLNRGKSSGLDLISNEMLKCGSNVLRKPLLHLFNMILKSGTYPKDWATNIIVPIHKSGTTTDPDNYRGIAISSCLSKTFNSILNKRLEKFMQTNDLWRKNQSGFMKKHRTEDNLFVFQTILQKYAKQSKDKVYVAFIDFRKYLDTINRDLLFYKLLKLNITGNFYSVLKSMYNKLEYCVQVPGGLTESFDSYSGVKQGCNLSPTLSNIFQNDLHDIFDGICDPVSLDNLTFNSMSWADDLVLFSTSPKGLQSCLDKLQNYCYKWGLEINTAKTKCMTLRNSLNTQAMDTFFINGRVLENVNKFTYLGIDITANGNMREAISTRILKANRAAAMCRQALSTTGNVSVQLALTIFEKQIFPILSYGSPIWGIPNITNTLYLDEISNNVIATQHAKDLVRNICNYNVKLDLVKQVRADPEKGGQSVIVKFQKYEDKQSFINNIGHQNEQIQYRDADWDPDRHSYQMVHNKYCKFVLNMSKYASSEACRGELGQYPLCNKIWILIIRYWLRLEQGTPNIFVNKAYQVAKENKHPWTQGIKALLDRHGFGYAWNRSDQENGGLDKLFQTSLNDQYYQRWHSNIHSSNRFVELSLLKNEFRISDYLLKNHNIETRNILTRLRIDMNKLMQCQGRQRNVSRSCPCCKTDNESVSHFLLKCPHFNAERRDFLNRISMVDRTFTKRADNAKLRVLLQADGNNDELFGLAVDYVVQLYNKRCAIQVGT